MTPSRFVLSAALASIAVLAAAPGCSSTTNPTSRVALFSQLGAKGAHPQSECQLTYTDWLDVGSVGNHNVPGSATQPVNDGDQDQGRPVHVTACSVTADGNGFLVNVSVTVDGTNGGAFTVNGHFNGDRSQSNVQAVFRRGDTGSFSENDCAATFTRDDADAPEMGVAAGRVWAHLQCPNVALTTQGSNARVCYAEAEFRFENCSQ